MSKSVILNFASGSLETGFSVNVQIYNDLNPEPEVSDCFDLPPNNDFDKTYRDWKRLLGSEDEDKNRLDYGCATRAKGGCTRTVTGSDFSQVAEQFREQMNTWLGSHSQLEQCIRTPLLPQEEIKIIVNAKDRQLQKLPWHLWKLFDEFARAEIAFSEPPAIKAGDRDSSRDELNILTILGSDGGIDVKKDLEVIKSLPANVVALSKPRRREISDELWDKSWDILFFSGHSNTVDGKGIIHINDTESMTIDELKNGLRKAIANGLRLAIFNSCDGLGLAWELKEARLQIPQLIVMREPVPDMVAQKFARYFLNDLAKDISFYRAFRDARERLKEEFQDIHPYTDWLPIAFQNPTQKVFSWKNEDSKVVNWTGLISDYQQKQLEITSNRLSGKHSNLPLIDLGLVERKKVKSVGNLERDGDFNNEEQEVITNYDNSTFFTEVLEQGNTPKQQGRIAIAGEPGAGKTTFLQQIASRVLERDWGIPIWISLKDIGTIGKEEGDSNKLQNYIYTSWLSQVLNKPPQSITESETTALTELFEQSKIWLLLDGLDEMRVTGVQSPLSAINQQLNNLSLKSPHRIVITCRQNLLNASSSNSLTTFDTFYTQKFNPQQVEQFIDNWFIQLPQYAVELKQQLAESQYENINYLIVNPLLLTMLCVIYERRQGANLGLLPETRAALYREFIAYYYNWKNEVFDISRADKDKLEKDVLGKIALWGLKNSSSRYLLLEEELKEFLQTEYNWQGKELYDWLFKLENTWLQKIGFAQQDTTQAAYAFLHPTFQEYFAATAINDHDFFLPKNHVNKPVPGKEYRIFDSQWQEVILFWSGLGVKSGEKQERNDFIEKLIDFEDGCGDWYHYRANFLAAKAIVEFDYYVKLHKQQLENKLKQWFVNYHFLHRSISEINNSIVCDIFLNFLQDKKSTNRNAALCSVWMLKTNNFHIIKRIITLLKDSSILARVRAKRILENRKSLIDFFYLPLINNEDPAIRRNAIIDLKEEISTPFIIDKIVSLLNDDDLLVRHEAVSFFSQVEEHRIIVKLIPLLIDNSVLMRVKVTMLLRSKGYYEIAKDTFIPLFKKDLHFNSHTIDILQEVRKPKVFRKIIPFLYNDNFNICKTAIEFLKEVDNVEVTDKIIPLLQDDRSIVRKAAVEALHGINNYCVIKKIIPLLYDSDPNVSEAAINCLKITSSSQIIEHFISLLQNAEDPFVRINVVEALKKTINPKIIQRIISLLQSNNAVVKADVVEIIKETDDLNVIEEIIYLLQDDSWIVRKAAIEALHRVNDPDVVKKITSLLNDNDHRVSKAAIEFLKEVDNVEVVDQIVPLLQDDSWIVRKAAIEFLKEVDNVEVVDQIIPFLQDDDSNVRQAAVNTLKTTSSPQIIKKILTYHNLHNEITRLKWNLTRRISYSDFFQAMWGNPLQNEEKQLKSTELQFKHTDEAFSLLIDLSALEGETNTTIIAQEICNEIYSSDSPELTPYLEENIPENIDNWSKLKTKLANIKRKLPQERLAIIFEQCDPHEELIQFCSKLTKTIDIGWITDKPVNNPKIRTFSPESSDLQSAINVWLQQLADGM